MTKLDDYWNRPCAAPPLASYRYRNGAYGYVMIGASCVQDALEQAARSVSSEVTAVNLETWNGSEYVQSIDPRPGHYYVSAFDPDARNGQLWLMLGPFNEHAVALALVDTVRERASTLDPRGVWMAYGTARKGFHETDLPAGKLNGYFAI